MFRPARLSPAALKDGYDWACREFYGWSSIARASLAHDSIKHQAKHFFYATGWKKFEPLWDLVIRARQLRTMTPLLEGVLSKVSRRTPNASTRMAAQELHAPFGADAGLISVNEYRPAMLVLKK